MNPKFEKLLALFLSPDPQAAELAAALDAAVEWKRFKRLPRYIAVLFESWDNALWLAVAEKIIELRGELISRGNLTV